MLVSTSTVVKHSMSVRFCSLYSANVVLTPDNRASCMRKFRDMLVKQDTAQVKRKAAVLIPIYVKAGKVSILYTLRATSLTKHRGQVSFPGGMADDSDESLQHTALRETEEELGIQQEDIELWGCGNPIVRQDTSVVPVVGCLRSDMSLDKLALNTREVEEVFTVSLQELCNPKLHRHTQFRGSYCAPTYLAGPHRIWGLTAVMTFMFLKALLPREAYKHKITYIPDVQKHL
ncbi:uncharacterized protein CBL_09099 [Carabus blaptoides fortunei]